MLQKKVCMVGAFAVGKTSLVQKFVHGIFSEKYLSTVGVKIDKAEVVTAAGSLDMVLWDIAGEDGFRSFNLSFLSGAAGLLFVVDPTRRPTLDMALVLKERVETEYGRVPSLALINKADLPDQNELTPADVARLEAEFSGVLRTSARTGEQVQAAFQQLGSLMLAEGAGRLQRRAHA